MSTNRYASPARLQIAPTSIANEETLSHIHKQMKKPIAGDTQ